MEYFIYVKRTFHPQLSIRHNPIILYKGTVAILQITVCKKRKKKEKSKKEAKEQPSHQGAMLASNIFATNISAANISPLFKGHKKYIKQHRCTDSRDAFIVKRGYFTMFSPMRGHPSCFIHYRGHFHCIFFQHGDTKRVDQVK